MITLPNEGRVQPALVKVLILGDTGVGRTTLISKIAQTSIHPDLRLTVGLHPAVVKLQIHEQEVHVGLWNVASQQRYEYVRSKLFQGAKGVVYVFSIENQQSYQNIPRWINEVQSVLGAIPSVLVGNKCDQEEVRCISKEEAQAFAKSQNIVYFETSTEKGPDLTGALNALISVIY